MEQLGEVVQTGVYNIGHKAGKYLEERALSPILSWPNDKSGPTSIAPSCRG